MVDPYTSSLKGKAFYVERKPVEGRMIGVLGGRVENRQLRLIPQKGRALLQGQIHELILTDEETQEQTDVVNRISYLGFFEVTSGGMVVAGDPLSVRGNAVGTVLGFDETHMPNHLNVVVSVSGRGDGRDLGVRCDDPLRIGTPFAGLDAGAPASPVSTSFIQLDSGMAIGVEVKLPKTTVLILSARKGYVMCGVLDVANLDRRLPERRVVAARVTGVKTFSDMLEARVELATEAARELGIIENVTTGREALELMF